MKLFCCDGYSSVKTERYPQLSTPLGALTVVCDVGSSADDLKLGTHVRRHNSKDSTIYEWLSPVCALEALVVAFAPDQPISSSELSCQALVLRVNALKSHLKTRYTLKWLPGHRWTEGFPESGEGLEARTWVNEEWKVTIGTEDREFLAARAKTGMWMSQRMTTAIEGSTEDIVQMTKDAISIELPELSDGQCCQVHFVIASNRRIEEDLSTWLAVDQPPSELLKVGDCLGEKKGDAALLWT
jgi:hypothetical protein